MSEEQKTGDRDDDDSVREELRQKLQKSREELVGKEDKPSEERGDGEPMIPPPATRAGG